MWYHLHLSTVDDETPNIHVNIWVVDWVERKRREVESKENNNKGSC